MFYNNQKNRFSWQFFAFIAAGLVLTIGIVVFLSALNSRESGSNQHRQVLSEKIQSDSILKKEYLQAVDGFSDKINRPDYDLINLGKDAEAFFLQTTVPADYLDNHLAVFVKFSRIKEEAGLDNGALLSALSKIIGGLKTAE